MSEIKLKKNYYNFLDHITFPIPIRVLQKKRNIEILIALKGTYDDAGIRREIFSDFSEIFFCSFPVS